MSCIGSRLPTQAGRLRILQLGMGQKLAHNLMMPLAINRIKVGVGQEYERLVKLIYQRRGIGNFIGIAAAVAVFWPVKDGWAGVKCEERNGMLTLGYGGLQHCDIGQALHAGNFRRVWTARLRHIGPKHLAVILGVLRVEWQA